MSTWHNHAYQTCPHDITMLTCPHDITMLIKRIHMTQPCLRWSRLPWRQLPRCCLTNYTNCFSDYIRSLGQPKSKRSNLWNDNGSGWNEYGVCLYNNLTRPPPPSPQPHPQKMISTAEDEHTALIHVWLLTWSLTNIPKHWWQQRRAVTWSLLSHERCVVANGVANKHWW